VAVSYGKGLHPPDPAKCAHRLHASKHPLLASGTPRDAWELVACPQLNQRKTSLCHVFSGVAAVWTALKAAGKGLPFVPSPRLLGSCVYADRRAAENPVGPLPKLQDTGADLSEDAASLLRWGLAPMVPTRTDDGLSDVDDTTANGTFPESDTSLLQVAGNTLIDGEYQIPIDSNAVDLCALAIDSGFPIWFGGPVNGLYEGLGPSDTATAACTVNGSGHAQYLRAHRKVAGKRQFQIKGSWGYSFADNGEVWADESFVLSQWSLWPMAIKIN
jgi:hypothetical protein